VLEEVDVVGHEGVLVERGHLHEFINSQSDVVVTGSLREILLENQVFHLGLIACFEKLRQLLSQVVNLLLQTLVLETAALGAFLLQRGPKEAGAAVESLDLVEVDQQFVGLLNLRLHLLRIILVSLLEILALHDVLQTHLQLG
jgi:hypothetical protein